MKKGKSIFENISTWDKLREIQKIKIIQSMYIWLAIVPLTAKLFSKMEDTLNFTVADKIYQLDLILPFSWILFFFSALLFTIGNSIFLLYAPKIIKQNEDFGEFNNRGRDKGHLEKYMRLDEKKEWKKYLFNLQQQSDKHHILTSPNEKEWFWKIYYNQRISKPIMRYLCLSLYFFGFFLFLIVAFENLWWVVLQII